MAAASNDSQARPIIAIAALGAERACLPHAHAGRFVCIQSGPGAERAAHAARAAIATGAAGLVAWGFAGALDEAVGAGALLLPERVRTAGNRLLATDAPWRRSVLAALGGGYEAHDGELVSVSEVLANPADKRSLRDEFGAVGVDMESGAILETALAAGVPCIVARVVLDTAADALPANAADWIDAQGNRRMLPGIAAAFDPVQWRSLAALTRRFRAARRSLRRLSAMLADCDFAFPYT